LFLMDVVKMVNKQCLHFLTTVWYNSIIAMLIFKQEKGCNKLQPFSVIEWL